MLGLQEDFDMLARQQTGAAGIFASGISAAGKGPGLKEGTKEPFLRRFQLLPDHDRYSHR
jgi:hypothetical protein